MSPATTPVLGFAVFVSDSAAVWSAVTVAEPVVLTGFELGSRPARVAVFENDPASTSAWVTV